MVGLHSKVTWAGSVYASIKSGTSLGAELRKEWRSPDSLNYLDGNGMKSIAGILLKGFILHNTDYAI